MIKETGVIICGFAGIGKSYLAKNGIKGIGVGIVDLESTPFQKDWKTYVRVASHMKYNGYVVLTSCHKELRQAFSDAMIEVNVVMPMPEDKEAYLERYKARGDSEQFIKMMSDNWDNFVTEKLDFEHYFIRLKKGTYLSSMQDLIYKYL